MLFSRAGGVLTPEQAQSIGRRIVEDKIMEPRVDYCLHCIKEKMKAGTTWRGEIITNPTRIPTGDPLEWVINDE